MQGKQRIPGKGQTLVMKFGGTSVGSAAAMRQVISIIREARTDWAKLVVVVSAVGGITDLLIETIGKAVSGEADFIDIAARHLQEAHHNLIEELIPQDLESFDLAINEVDALIQDFISLCKAIEVLGEATPRAYDAVSGLGERMCVRILANALNAQGVPAQYVDATSLIVTDNNFQAAHPDLILTQAKSEKTLEPIFANGDIPIVTGYIATTPDGVTSTLGRGGSDYSAAILGAVLHADDVWIWTDVDGVMSADPRVVTDARTIPVLSYREIAELAYFGAKVVHPKTIRPVIESRIGLRVCNTFNPLHPGTRVVEDNNSEGNHSSQFSSIIKAVTAIRGQSLITVEGRGMLGVPGVAARTFGAVAATGTSVPLITQASSEQSICFAVPIETAERVCASLEDAFSVELQRKDIDRIRQTGVVTIITIVGAGMSNTPGIAGRIFSSLGADGVNVIAIAQGSSEVAISLVVDATDADAGLIAVHRLIVDRISRP